ncbi:MAG: TolC family protein, partial [Bdellovibrio sp.]
SRKKLETAQASIETGKEALKLAISSVNEARRSFNFANIDFFQFLTVQKGYVEAQQSLNQYKYDYIVALTNYFAASGQDMEKLVELLEKANL